MTTATYRPLGLGVTLRRTGKASEDRQRVAGPADCGVTLGIDLGNTNMVVAAMVDGDVEVLCNDIGARTTPSVVHVHIDEAEAGSPSRKTREERQTGEAALRLAVTDPDKTIRNAKRVIGRAFSSVRIDPGKPLLGAVRVIGTNTDSTKIRVGDSTLLTPEEVVGTLLLEMKKYAETHINRGSISDAWIAVPSYFNIAQRQAVIDAANLAGIRSVRLVNETTAAAAAYAHERDEPKTVVVLDIGGGGGSVSLARVQNGEVHVEATCGTRLPGGEDLDARMVAYLVDVIKRDHEKEVKDPRSLEILRSSWERAKQKLSRIPQVQLSTYLPGVDLDFKHDISRTLFEAQCGAIFTAIHRDLLQFMELLGGTHFDSVLLVGGSTRIPWIRNTVNSMLGEKMYKALNPDEAVAVGAALLAAGAVRVSKELMGIETEVTLDDRSFAAHIMPIDDDRFFIQRQLPRCFAKPKGSFSVEQRDVYAPQHAVSIYEDGGSCPLKVRVNASGLLVCSDMFGQPMNYVPPYCLNKQLRQQLNKKMEKLVHGELVEMDRIKAKNSLENFLREELSKELPEDDWLEEERALKEQCNLMLLEISDDSNLAKERVDEAMSHVSGLRKKIDEARYLAAMETRKGELRVSLANELKELLQEEVSEDDAAFELVGSLRSSWVSCDEWLKSRGQDATAEELESKLMDMKECSKAVRTAREARRQQARTRLGSLVNGLMVSLQVAYEVPGTGELLNALTVKCQEVEKWLERHPNASEMQYDCYISDLSKAEKQWKEVSQDHFKLALQHHLNEAMSSCPPDEEFMRYSVKFADIKCWLDAKSENVSGEELQSKLHSVMKEASLMKKDLQSIYSGILGKLKAKISEVLDVKLDSNMPCLPLAQSLVEFCHEKQAWIAKDPAVTQRTLTLVRSHLTELHKKISELKRSQTQDLKQKYRRELSKKIKCICNFRDEIQENDICRDLYIKLWTLCDKNYLPFLANEKYGLEELKSYLREINEKESEIKEERAKRGKARCLLIEALDLLKKENKNLAAPHLTWVKETPAAPAEEFETRRRQVLEEAGKISLVIPQTANLAEPICNSSNVAKVICKSDPEMEIAANIDEGLTKSLSAPSANQRHVAVEELMSSLWTRARMRARCDPPGWDLKVPEPLEKSHLLDALGALATALAVERLREAAEVGAMVLLVHKQRTDSRCLLSLSVRSLEVRGQGGDQGKGKPVEALLMVRLVEVGSNDGELLAQDFLSLCERSNVLWRAMLVGVSVEGAGQEGKAFMQTLRTATGANITQLPNTGLPLEDRVAFSCYDHPLDETRSSVASQFFSVLDWLRRLFAVDGLWFPLLRDTCESLTEDDFNPWRSYATSIAFVSSEYEAILEALSHLATEEPIQFQVAAALNESLKCNGFRVCLWVLGHLFTMAAQFFQRAGITPDIQLDKVKQMPANPLGAEGLTQSLVTRVRSSIGLAIPDAEEKDLPSVVSECVALTAAAVEAVLCQAANIAAVLGQPVSEAVPAAEYGPEFAAEMAQLSAALGDHQLANLYAALQSHNVKDVKRRFPALYARVVHAFVLPLIPPWGPRADQQLQELCERTASCPADRLNDFAVLVAHHREEPPLQAALRLMAEGSK